jgi:hypothetical protein
MTPSPTWDQVTDTDVWRAIDEYDRLGPERFFSEHGFAPTTTYQLVWNERRYPPKAILGTAYEEEWRRQGARKAWIHHPAATMSCVALAA